MKTDDITLIRRILTDDETAFAELVKKYQKPVHALAWRKVGDFHIAEEITQDDFLKVYQRLHTLKEPKQFSGWLYVITTNLCATWLRKKRIRTQPLEDAETMMMPRDAYSQHVVDDRNSTAIEEQREVIKKLLAKLKESERTVMTLHYLGEMTVEEISRFLGVSGSTIKSRLRRARNRLQKEETMIREALEHFQISPNLTDNILQEVSHLKPISSGSKPLVPWAIAASSAILILLMLGIGSQYLPHFQQPYSLDAQAEMTVELVDAPVVQNVDAKQDVRREVGRADALGVSDNNGQKPDEVVFAAVQEDGEDKASAPKLQWIQSEPSKGSRAYSFHATPEGELYILGGSAPSIYKLSTDEKGWQHLYDIIQLETSWSGNSPIAKWKNTLYFIPSHELFASKDDGKTWDLVHSWSKENDAVDIMLTDEVFYLAFNNGIFHSKDNGKTWQDISDGLMGSINALVKIHTTLFAGTDNGLYRLNENNWQRMEFPVSVGRIRSVASTEQHLYVAAELSDDLLDPRKVSRGLQRSWWIFRSSNMGNSWDDITPSDAWTLKGWPPFVKLIASGDTLLAMEKGMVRSTDNGDTWMQVQPPDTSPSMNADVNRAAVVNGNIFYVGSYNDELHRSTDNGKSWNKVNIDRKSSIENLLALNTTSKEINTPSILYARTDKNVIYTINDGKSWNDVQVKSPIKNPDRESLLHITHIVKSGNNVYAKGGDSLGRGKTRLYRVLTDDNMIVPIQDIPIFDSTTLRYRLHENLSVEQMQKIVSGATQFFEKLANSDLQLPSGFYMQLGFRTGAFAVSGDMFYMEYNYKLFRWKRGDTEWHDTGLEETTELTAHTAMKHLKLAISGNTVYVGKRDGHLVVSFDNGNSWTDLTPALPFPVKIFNDIVVAGSTVYVATDAGIITSDDGRNWHTVTDTEGTNLIMEHLSIDGTILYGVNNNTGIYRLESRLWKQIISDMPDKITSLAVDGNTLYLGTRNRGMLHYTLEE
ncbi:MAG: sigma-70 family RNA polymerase sigma factor [Candidatus Poribacteria bacterium]|nr:sigma-70 family RNA polymerase sigma factor [Candidatus Poribacteria bacterium]